MPLNTQIKLALSGDKRRSLLVIRILLTAMFLEGHKNGIPSIESSPYEPRRNIIDILP